MLIKPEISVLVIASNPSLYNSVSGGAARISHGINVYSSSTILEALETMANLEVRSDRLQIYLDSKSSKAEAQRFLRILDRDYPGTSRRMVILADDASNISSIVSLALAECVGDVLNYPISSTEVKTAIQKQFPKLRTSIRS